MKSLKIRSPAKINLYLEIGPKRLDGFHSLKSLFARLNLSDTVCLQLKFGPLPKAPVVWAQGNFQLAINWGAKYPLQSRHALAEDPSQNSVAQAWRLITRLYPDKAKTPVRALVTKNIPARAGLGGGSSNAAAALIGLSRLLGLRAPARQLMRWGALLGSDVPFFVAKGVGERQSASGALSWVSGRGERIKPLTQYCRRPVLLIHPGFGMSTTQAYRNLDHIRGSSRGAIWLTTKGILPTLLDELRAYESETNRIGYNSFEAVLARQFPVLEKMAEKLRAMGAGIVAPTGSGSCWYALGGSLDECRDWTRLLARNKDFAPFHFIVTCIA